MRPANAFRTIRSSAEHVRTLIPASNSNELARAMIRAFVRQPAERDIEWDAVGRLDEQHATLERETPRVCNPISIVRQYRIDELLFSAEASKDCHVHVASLARLTPALNREASDHAASPSAA